MTTMTDRPPRTELNFGSIAAELRELDQWVVWRWVWNEASSKWGKPPFTLDGKHAASTKPDDWTTLEAVALALTAPDTPSDGAGFTLTKSDPYVVIDLDHCRVPESGEILKWSPRQRAKWSPDAPEPAEIIDRLGSYTEVSPSGTGFHIFMYGKPAAGIKRGDFECYSHSRFIYMTGQHLGDTPATLADKPEALAVILEEFCDTPEPAPPPRAVATTPSGDDAILEKARRASNGPKFTKLYDAGDFSDFPSQSEADQSLCNALSFWFGPDPQRIERMFRASALMRPKVDRHATYLHDTIAKSLEGRTEFYGQRDRSRPSSQPPAEPIQPRIHQPVEQPAEQPEEERRYRQYTSDELDRAVYQTNWLIERTLVAGQPCILAGGKKCLKTSLLVDLCVSLARGDSFLGELGAARGCRVGLMSGESGMSTLQETARRTCWSKGFGLADLGNSLIWSDELPRFGRQDHLDAIGRFLSDNELEVLAIDPAYLCIDGDGREGSLFQMGSLLIGMAEVCHHASATLIIAHHTKKGVVNPFSPPELEHIAWSGFQEFARQWLLVGRRERYEPGSGSHRLWLNIGGSAGHSALWAVDIAEGVYDGHTDRKWEVTVTDANQARQDAETRIEENREEKSVARVEKDKAHILNAMVKFPSGETKSTIKNLTSARGQRFDAAFTALLREDDIRECVITKNGRQYDAFQIKETGE